MLENLPEKALAKTLHLLIDAGFDQVKTSKDKLLGSEEKERKAP